MDPDFRPRTMHFGWWRGTRWTTTDLSGQPRQRISNPRILDTLHRQNFVFVQLRPSFLADRFLRVWLGVTRLSQLDLADLFNLLDTRGLSSSLIE
jgi:hypothetical protein